MTLAPFCHAVARPAAVTFSRQTASQTAGIVPFMNPAGVIARAAALIVDDNASMLAALRDMLSPYFPRLRIFEAASGAQGMVQFSEHRPALVVMDVHLPDADGIDLTRRIVAMTPSTCVVVISIRSEPRIAAQALAAGAAAFIPKDRLFTELTDVLGRLPGIRKERS